MEHIDLLIDARWVIPVEPDTVLLNHTIAVDKGKIADILPTPDAHREYAASEHVFLGSHALIPGLFNGHTHAAMSLMRGMADDLPLMRWLNEHIWPAERKHLSPEFVYDGTRLCCAEMLKGGITSFSDMYFFPKSVAQAALDCGMRASIGLVILDFPTPYASDGDDYLAKGLAARDFFGDSDQLSFAMSPHAPYTVSDKTFARLQTYAEELDLPVHIHLHETEGEISQSLEEYRMRPVSRLNRLDLLGPSLAAVHMVRASKEDIELLAGHGCHVVHCPTSNLKLSSGMSPIAEMREAGINVALGTDGAASNNRQDVFSEMRLTALLGQGKISARDCLKMATLGGARAFGLERKTGSLEKGKAADIAAVNFSSLELSPLYDPISHLVYCAGREHVSHVWVNGMKRVENGKLAAMDEADIMSRASYWKERMK